MKISNPGSCTCQESPRLLSNILAIHRQGKNSLFSLVWPWIHCPAQTALKLEVLLLLSPAVHTCHQTKKDFLFGLVLCSCIFMYMSVLPIHMCTTYMCGDAKSQKRASDPRDQSYIIDGWESQCGYWEPNQAPLKEQRVQKEVSVCWHTVATSLSETVRSERLVIPGPPQSSLTGREVLATSFHYLWFSL